MSTRNALLETPPYPVEQAVKQLGENLRTARVRRNLTIAEVAEKIGTGMRAVAAAEQGKISTGIGIYIALLWAYDLLDPLTEVADPNRDDTGLALLRGKERTRARYTDKLDNDF